MCGVISIETNGELGSCINTYDIDQLPMARYDIQYRYRDVEVRYVRLNKYSDEWRAVLCVNTYDVEQLTIARYDIQCRYRG